MRASGIITIAGIVLLLSAPIVAITPLFSPPPGGCPCPNGLDVSTPFGDLGIIVGIFGWALIMFSSFSRRKMVASIPEDDRIYGAAGIAGFVVLTAAAIVSSIDISGNGYQIYLYGGQGLYLGALGVGMLLFTGIGYVSRTKAASLFLAVGTVLVGLSLLFSSISNSEFLERCLPTECSSVLATYTVSELLNLGYLLAVGSFLMGLGLATVAIRRKHEAEARATPKKSREAIP